MPTATQSLVQNAASPNTKYTPLPSQSPAYRLALSQRILSMCSQSMYENVTNFEWYISVLVDLAHVANVDVGAEIRDRLVDVVGRVRAVRRYAVKLMYSLLSDDTMLDNAAAEGSCSEVLWAAAWICGEYPESVPNLFFLCATAELFLTVNCQNHKDSLLTCYSLTCLVCLVTSSQCISRPL